MKIKWHNVIIYSIIAVIGLLTWYAIIKIIYNFIDWIMFNI